MDLLGAVIKLGKIRLVFNCSATGLNAALALLSCQHDTVLGVIPSMAPDVARGSGRSTWPMPSTTGPSRMRTQTTSELMSLAAQSSSGGVTGCLAKVRRPGCSLLGVLERHGLRYMPADARAAQRGSFQQLGAYLDDFILQSSAALSREERSSCCTRCCRCWPTWGGSRGGQAGAPCKRLEYLGH